MNIQVLTQRHFLAHSRKLSPRRLRDLGVCARWQGGAHEIVAPGEEKVTREERGGEAKMRGVRRKSFAPVECLKSSMGCWLSPPRVRVVHDVIVHKGRSVEDLEGDAQGQNRVEVVERFHTTHRVEGVGEGIDRAPTPIAKASSKPLPVGQQGARIVQEVSKIGGDGRHL